jgi:hypothetical protein
MLSQSNYLPACDITSASFGTIRSTYPPRQSQFAMRLMV